MVEKFKKSIIKKRKNEMAINWTISGFTTEAYIYNNRTWEWNGEAWSELGDYVRGLRKLSI
jgi:hypothetical protein